MPFKRSFNTVGVHCGGEVCDVVVGGVRDVPGKTMYDKMMHFWKHEDHLRNLLLNEPRGCSAIVPAMSGANTVATVTCLLETGMVTMQEPKTVVKLDAPAGLVTAYLKCENGKCKSVRFHNVPAFVFATDKEISVPELGTVKVDIAYGGMIYVLVDAASVGLKIKTTEGARLVKVGELHPENPGIHGVTIIEFTEPLYEYKDGKAANNTVVVSPGRLDRSPCGTGTCARLAVLHAKGELKEGENFYHRGITGTEFVGRVEGTTKVGEYSAIYPSVEGQAWITSFKQVVLDSTDPFPEGFRVGDTWHLDPEE
ncbi:putative proline racemase [Fusarium proliferatum ET1]|uniref:Probable proline racemase n=1 Tax=Fusarium proliferatum (strain ET1) TaxID=1227346 RepID=A0A1L7VPY7_FUSPR|nr:putative proline racemase [Fusarium proliferatum ET1]CZR42538.1 probable proline racemase [Fusarium proliferatum ET1]